MTGKRVSTFVLFAIVGVAASSSSAQKKDSLTPLSVAAQITSHLDRDSSAYESTINAMVSTYCLNGNFDAAFDSTQNLARNERVQLLSYVAKMAVKAGKTETANRIIKFATDLIPVDDEGNSDFWAAPELVEISLDNNNPELALSFLTKAEEGRQKGRAFLLLADYFLKKNEKAKALSFVERAVAQINREEDEDDVWDLTLSAATTLVKLDQNDRAKALREKLALFPDAMQRQSEYNLGRQMSLYARMGEWTQAMSLLAEMENQQKIYGLVSLSLIHKEQGNESSASSLISLAQEIAADPKLDPYSRSRCFSALINAYLMLGEGSEALELLSKSEDSSLSGDAIKLADWFHERKRVDESFVALRIATRVTSKVVSEKSEDIPGSASGSNAQFKSRDLTALVEKYVEFGSLSDAMSAARAIDQPQYRASALAAVGAGYAKLGDRNRGREVLLEAFRLSDKSSQYNHDTSRDATLLLIAKTFAEIDYKEEAAHVAARFLREVRDATSYGGPGALYALGIMVEAKAIPINKDSESLLKEILKRAEDEN